MSQPSIKVIIPANNEAGSIAQVIREIPKTVDEIIVVNNRSTDDTFEVAKKAGATVLNEEKMGYGYACLKGMEYIAQLTNKPEIVVFLDGDYSDYPEELSMLVAPILNREVDFVVGARTKVLQEPGSMTFQQRFGNKLATILMKYIFGSNFTDLGPFRAIRYSTLVSLNMQDKTYGWTVEMQLKVLKKNLPYAEIPVRYKKRIGVSKVSGTLKGTIFAGYKILSWIFKYSLK
ncbi:MAG: glycosyltransferase family 2 protein [Flavobacteriaceae bacterium]|nr:glycosyltransferase family 2 protein [Flavobacteriaceae bacterium]MDZ4146856.1 glycosyltransferase family 2 protein [Flavobacteriaceae bacterium]